MKFKNSLIFTVLLFTIFTVSVSGSMGTAYAAAATVSSADVTGPNEITIVFSDPLDWVIGDFTDLNINAGARGVVSIAETAPTSTVTITFDGVAVGTDATGDIDITAIVDGGSGNTFAGSTDESISDDQKPTMDSGITGPGADEITYTFSEAMDEGGTIVTGDFATVNGFAASGVVVSGADVTVTFASNFGTGFTDTLKERFIGGESVNDANGNTLTQGSGQPSVTITDGLSPTLVSAKTTSATTVDVTFSEDMDTGGTIAGNGDFTVDNVETNAADVSGAVVTLTMTQPNAFATDALPTIRILGTNGGVNDANGNTLAVDATGVVATDEAAPTFTVSRTAANTFIVETSEPVTGTAISGSFSVADETAATTNTAVTTNTSITLTTTGLTDTSGTPAVTYNPGTGNILDNSPATNALDAGPVNAVDNAPPTFTADRTALNTIELSFSEPITAVPSPDTDSFLVADATTVSAVLTNSQLITLTTTDLTSTSSTPAVDYVALLGDVFDQSSSPIELADGGAVAATDSVAPTFTAERTALNTIVLQFSEPITSTGADLDSFDVVDATTVSAAAASGSTITLTTTGLTETFGTPLVTYALATGDVVDQSVSGVVPLADGANANADDSVAPTFTASRTSATTIDLLFSEDVTSTTTDGVGWTLDTGAVVSTSDPAGISDTITLTISGIDNTGITPTVTYTQGDVVVADTASNEVANAANALTVDNAPPTFTVDRSDVNTFDLTFSEDITGTAIDDSFTVAGSTATVTNSVEATPTTTMTVTTTDLTDTFNTPLVTYNAPPGDIVDGATNIVVNGESATATDSVAPTFTAEHLTPTTTKVTFSEGMQGTWQLADWQVDGNVGGVTSMIDNNNAVATEAAVNAFSVTLTHQTLLADDTKLVEYVSGNMADFSAANLLPIITATTATDGIAPTFTADRTALNTIELAFSEPITSTSPDTDSFLVADATTVSAVLTNSQLITLTTTDLTSTSSTPQVDYVLANGDIADTATVPNLLADAATADATDSVAPTFTADRTGVNTIILQFSEPISAVTSPDENSFTVAGASAVSAFDNGGDTITLTTTNLAGTSATPEVNYVLGLGNVFDESVSGIVPLADGGAVIATDGVSPVLVSAITGPASDEVSYTFSEDMDSGSIEFGDFAIVDGNTADKITSVTNEVVIVSFNGDINTGFTDISDERLAAGGTVSDIPGNFLDDGDAGSSVAITDGLAPTWSAVHDTLTQTTITFSEPMAGTVEFADWTFGGNNPTSANNPEGDPISGTTITFGHPDLATTATESASFSDISVVDVTDAVTIVLTETPTSVTEQIAPTYTATTTTLTTTTLQFSEGIEGGTFVNNQWFVAGTNGGVSISTVGPATGQTTAVLTHDALANTGITPTIQYSPGDLVDQNNIGIDFSENTATDGITPTFTAIRSALNTIDLIFSEDIDGSAIDDSFTVAGGGTVTNTAQSGVTTMTLTTTELTSTGGTPTVTYVAGTGDIVDAGSNEVADGENANAADSVAPTFTADRTALNTIVLTFSEIVDTPGTAGEGYDVAGATVTDNSDPLGTNIITLTTTGLTATDGTPLVTYTIASGVTVDVSVDANEVADGTNANAADFVSPTMNSAVTTSTTTIDVTFSEDLDGAGTIAASDFTVVANVVQSAFELADDGIVTLTLTTPIGTDDTPDVALVSGIADVSSNTLGAAGPITPTDGVAPTLVSAKTGPLNTQVTYTFSEDIASGTVLAGDFADVNGEEPSSVSVSGSVVTVTFSSSFASDFTAISTELFTTLAAVDDLVSNSLTQGTGDTSEAITDGIAPSMVSAETGPNANQISYTFDEPMSTGVENIASDFDEVEGNPVAPTGLQFSDGDTVITVTFVNDFDSFFTDESEERLSFPAVSSSLADVAGNFLETGDPGSSVAIDDGLAPTYTAVTTTLTTTTLHFSEDIDAGTFDNANWKVQGTNDGVSIDLDGQAASLTVIAVLTHDALTDEGTLPTILYTPGDLADEAGNALTGSPESVTDGIAPVITTTLPENGATLNDDETFDYSFSEQMGSAVITFDEIGTDIDPNDPHTDVLAGGELFIGGKSQTILQLQASFGNSLVDGADYTITITGQDDATIPNGADAVQIVNITYDTTATNFSAETPAASSFNNDADTVGYSLDGDLVLGTITFTQTGGSPDGNSPHTYTLTGTQLTDPSTLITFANINLGLTNNLVDGAIYTIDYDGEDVAGNTATTLTTLGVTYDVTIPVITTNLPLGSSDINNDETVDYDLSETVASGTITFTQTSGTVDPNTPHTYSFDPADVTSGNHAITVTDLQVGFGKSLVDGSIYKIDIDATDAAGNDAVTSSTFAVTYDTTAPTITDVTIISDSTTNTEWAKDGDTITVTITGDELLTVTDATFNGFANDAILDDGTLSPEIQRIVTAGEDVDGATLFSITVEDPAGNPATTIVAVTDGSVVTIDKVAPDVTGETDGISVGGSTQLTLTDVYADSCTATDEPHAAPSCDVQSGSDTIDTTVLGLQEVTYEAIDEAGNVGLRVISTTVIDTVDPVIGPVTIESDNSDITLAKSDDTITVTITGNEILEVQPNPTINGLPATIDTNNALTVVVTRTVVDGVDPDTLLTPFSVYVNDPADNSVEVFSLTEGVNVVTDTTGPTFTVEPKGTAQGGSFTTNIIKDFDTYTPNTIDNQSDNSGSGVATSVIDGDTLVDESADIGDDFTVTYTVTDNAGNSSVVTETVTIVEGGIPVITLTGTDETIQVQSTYVDAGAEATDAEDNDATLTAAITTTGLPIDTSAVGGPFTITYDVTDSSGNDAVQVTRTVNVVDTTIPIITITGDNPAEITVGAVYTDAGATATDVADGNISGSIVTDLTQVDTSVAGSFDVTYDVEDSAFNDAVQVTRTVNVVAGNTPVVTVLGDDTVGLKRGATYNDAGATCTDVEDGTLTDTGLVTTGLPINTSIPGVQTVTYTCTDASGNETVDTRSVQVVRSGGSSNDRAKTAPTSGLDWNTGKRIVDNGIVANGVAYHIDDNWHTDFDSQHTSTGKTNTFSTKTFAQNGGLAVHEIAFGMPRIGEYDGAESLIEVYYDYDKTIREVRVIQDTEVVDESSLSVTTSQVKCRADAEAMCYQTNFNVEFREPLQSDVFAIKSIDMSRRSMMPTYLNDGIIVDGESLNPMKTIQIPGTEKYEGLIEITQSEKYSDLWFAADGRIFEVYGPSDSVRLVSLDTLKRIDTGNADNRNHSGHAAYQEALAEEYKKIFDSSKLQKLVPESFTYDFPDVDSRTQFLIDNGLLEFVRN